MSAPATRRAVSDVLAHGFRGDLVQSKVGRELGAHLQSGLTEDVSEGVLPGDILEAMRDACEYDPVAYARMLELLVLASLDELQVLVGLPEPDWAQDTEELLPPPPRRPPRRRR